MPEAIRCLLVVEASCRFLFSDYEIENGWKEIGSCILKTCVMLMLTGGC
jgi:hypothetical protein